MNVGELMTRGAWTCNAHDPLTHAAQIMWDQDCGCVPVVDDDGRVVGMITDRDVCMAAYTRGEPLSAIPVSAAASHGIVAVRETDELDAAERLMQRHQIRRVPVVDPSGRPIGVLSMTDLARFSRSAPGKKTNGLAAETIVDIFAAVCQPTPRVAVGS